MKSGVNAAIRCWPAAVLNYVATALISLPLALAVGYSFHTHLSASADADIYARGLDPTMILAVLTAKEAAAVALVVVVIGLVVLWGVASTYLTGATLAVLVTPRSTSAHDLYESGGRVFGRLMRLLGFSGPFWLLVVGLPSYGLYKGIEALTRDWASERAVLAARLAALGIAVLLLCWASTTCDLMRVEAVARGERRARFAFWRGLVRGAKKPFAPLSIAFIYTGAMVVVTLLHSLFDAHFARSSMVWIAVGFVLQQAVAFSRAFLRVAALGSAVDLHRQRRDSSAIAVRPAQDSYGNNTPGTRNGLPPSTSSPGLPR